MTTLPLAKRVVVDTNVFIGAFRSEARNEAVRGLHARLGPREFLSSIVAQELRAGVRSEIDRRRLERSVLERFSRTGRVVVPSGVAWERSGDVLAALRARNGLDISRVSKSFGNDVLLALSCREWGATLITDNVRDFARIAQVVPFDYVTF